jgi:uncharacterized membrane protein
VEEKIVLEEGQTTKKKGKKIYTPFVLGFCLGLLLAGNFRKAPTKLSHSTSHRDSCHFTSFIQFLKPCLARQGNCGFSFHLLHFHVDTDMLYLVHKQLLLQGCSEHTCVQ